MIKDRRTRSSEYATIGLARDSKGLYLGHKDNRSARAIRRAKDKVATQRAFAEYVR